MKGITISIGSCRECPYLRHPWSSAISPTYACGNSHVGGERPSGEEHWLGGDALPGDRMIDDVGVVQGWCALRRESSVKP